MKPGTYRIKVALVAVVIAALAAFQAGREREPSPQVDSGPFTGMRDRTKSAPPADRGLEVSRVAAKRRADFDFYLLAMTVHGAFCADHGDKPECRAPAPRPLVIHGLWPEKLEPRAYPRDCPAPALDLEPALARELAGFMPGMSAGLHQHEWRRHGGCSGLGDDEYFQRTLELARHLDAALRAELTIRAGDTATPADLRAAADRLESGLGATLTFHCRTLRGVSQSRPALIEIRQCVDDDGANGGPGTPLACARVDRRDQGCGQSFWIADA